MLIDDHPEWPDYIKPMLNRQGGHVSNTTNNRMEMQAIITALKSARLIIVEPAADTDILIVTDSKYVKDNYYEYLPNWKKNGWRKTNGAPVLNQDLWQEIDRELGLFKSHKIEWVKGHAGNEFNEWVDKEAQKWSKAPIKAA